MSMPRAPTPALVWLGRVLAYAVLALFTLGVVYALAAVVFDSLKSQNEFFTNPWGSDHPHRDRVSRASAPIRQRHNRRSGSRLITM
jgi:ABC-type glycerol-3-phosphate transport system permease component